MNHTMDLVCDGVSRLDAAMAELNESAEVDLWHLNLDATAHQTEAAASFLDDSERARASRFHRDQDRVSFIMRRAMRRLVLSRYLQIEPRALDIQQTAGGPPRLASDDTLQFSTAHRGTLGVIAVTRGARIGVDIEPIIDASRVDVLVSSCLHPLERACYAEIDSSRRAHWFTQIWTRKEAVLKMLGVGFAIEPRELCVMPESDRIACDRLALSNVSSLTGFEPRPGWCGSVIIEDARSLMMTQRTLNPGMSLQDV